MTFLLLDLPQAALKNVLNQLDLIALRSLSKVSEKFKKWALFPLFRLPHFALKNVINQLDVCTVLYFTMTSSKFLRKVQRVRYDVDHLHFFHWKRSIFISYFNDYETKRFKGLPHFSHGPQPNSPWIFNLDVRNQFTVYAESDGSWPWENGKLNGEPVEIFKWTSKFRVRAAEDENSRLEVLENVARHLLSIFTVTKFNVEFYYNFDVKNLFIWKFHKKIESLTIKTTNFEPFEPSPEELNFILRDVNSELLDLPFKVPGYKYQGPLRGKTIFINDSSWIDFDAITIDNNTVSITFKLKPPFNLAGINRLFKDWIAGKNEKLEELDIYCWSREHRDDTPIYEGLDVEESSISEGSRKNPESYREIRRRETLQDIVRTTDGRRATIATSDSVIGLFPWKE